MGKREEKKKKEEEGRRRRNTCKKHKKRICNLIVPPKGVNYTLSLNLKC